MNKYALLIAGFSFINLAYSFPVPVEFCPGTSQILLSKNYNFPFGIAYTADGKWKGTYDFDTRSGIFPWPSGIDHILYNRVEIGGKSTMLCMYCAGATGTCQSPMVSLTSVSIPSNYNLYSINTGFQPQAFCIDKGSYQNSPQSITEYQSCYFYKNSI